MDGISTTGKLSWYDLDDTGLSGSALICCEAWAAGEDAPVERRGEVRDMCEFAGFEGLDYGGDQ